MSITTSGATRAAGLVGKVSGPLSAAAVLDDVVGLISEWIRVHEEQSTQRANSRAVAEVKIAEIHARRDLFMAYLDRTFDEREKHFKQLFRRLDEALSNQPELAGAILTSITTLALKSPFADLHDPVALREKLDDASTEWEV